MPWPQPQRSEQEAVCTKQFFFSLQSIPKAKLIIFVNRGWFPKNINDEISLNIIGIHISYRIA